MEPAKPRILTVNGGSSSIKFALFEAGDSLRRILDGAIERIGLPDATLRVTGANPADGVPRPVPAPDHMAAVSALMERVAEPHDIDEAMRLGTNYPFGPLAWADEAGLDTVLGVMTGLFNEWGEDRYRPSPLLNQHHALEFT